MDAEQSTAGLEIPKIVKDGAQQTPLPNLFVNGSAFQSVRLSDLMAEYYIDNSASTIGEILENEKSSADMIMKVMKESQIVAWNHIAIGVA